MRSMIFDPRVQKKKYSVGERNAWGAHGSTIRSEQYRLMIWKDTNGDTLDMELFDNSEYPIPYRNLAEEEPEIVQELLSLVDE